MPADHRGERQIFMGYYQPLTQTPSHFNLSEHWRLLLGRNRVPPGLLFLAPSSCSYNYDALPY
jgi:hypothetical protein